MEPLSNRVIIEIIEEPTRKTTSGGIELIQYKSDALVGKVIEINLSVVNVEVGDIVYFRSEDATLLEPGMYVMEDIDILAKRKNA